MVENPYGWSCPATNPLSWVTSRTAHASSFGSVFPSSLGAAVGQMFDGWKKYGSTRSHPTFLQFQLSKTHIRSSDCIKVQSSRNSSIFVVFGSNFIGPHPKRHQFCQGITKTVLEVDLKSGIQTPPVILNGESNASEGAPFFGHLFWEKSPTDSVVDI